MAIMQWMVDTIRCPGGQSEHIVHDHGRSGFGVRVTPSGGASYLYDYVKRDGTRTQVHIGSCDAMTVEDARYVLPDVRARCDYT